MRALTIDAVRALLPPLPELGPLMSGLLATSEPDPERRWSGAGELETVGERRIRPAAARRALETALRAEAERAAALGARALRALEALEAGDADAAADALLEAATLEERAWRMESARAWALAAHRAVEGERDRGRAALALRRAARATRFAGRAQEAAALYGRAHALSALAGDEVGAAVAAIGSGNVEVDRGRWEAAGAWYRRALAHVDQAGGEGLPERWHACQNLSIVARRSGDLAESRRWLEDAEAAARAIGDPDAGVDVENGWGMWELAAGNAVAAEARFRQALEGASDPRARVTVSVNLGQALLAQARTLEAAEAARSAEAEAVRSGITVKLPEVYRLLGEVAAARGHADAFVFHERALELIESERLPVWERAETLEAYARLLEREGRTEEAAGLGAEAARIRRGLERDDNGAPDRGVDEEDSP